MESVKEHGAATGLVDSLNIVESDVENSLFRAKYDSDRESVCLTVVAAVAFATDRDPNELSPLHSAINADALDNLFSSSTKTMGRNGRISFSYEGTEVTVHNVGTIEINSADNT